MQLFGFLFLFLYLLHQEIFEVLSLMYRFSLCYANGELFSGTTKVKFKLWQCDVECVKILFANKCKQVCHVHFHEKGEKINTLFTGLGRSI